MQLIKSKQYIFHQKKKKKGKKKSRQYVKAWTFI